MSKKPVIGFAGMTHLGINSAVAAAYKGFQVMGFDPDAARVTQLQSGNTDITEPDLSELLHANAQRLTFTSSAADLRRCDIVYISMDVPTDDKGASDLAPVQGMIELVNGSLPDNALLVVLCQVPPGFTRSIQRNADKLYYQVETLIFGRAVERALHPERYIVGCADPAMPMDERYRQFLEAYGCPILPMRYESAELGKTAINLFLAAQVCTSNTLAEVCEKIGADWQEIVPALQLDKRIGQYAYLQPGLGLSGGNIERDLQTVWQLGYEHGARVSIPRAYADHSRYRKEWALRAFFEHYNGAKDFKICILGLAYKINTHSVKNSPAVELIEALPDIRIHVYDPVVKKLNMEKSVCIEESAYAAAKDADMLCIMTPWDEFKTLDWKKITNHMRGHVMIDPFRLISGDDASGFSHLVLGKAA